MKSFSSILVDGCRSLLILALFICICNGSLQAQNEITGTWQGRFLSHSFDLGEPKLVIEIHAFGDSMFTGITHLYYNGNFYEHYKMIGKYFKRDSILAMKESSTIAVDLGKYGNCLGTYVVKLSRRADKLVLEGVWQPNNAGCTSDAGIYLEKKIGMPEKTLPPPSKTPGVKPRKVKPPVVLREKVKTEVKVPATTPIATGKPPVLKAPAKLPESIAMRETDVQSLLEISPREKDSIKVEVYDNGEIDGDSVSVYEDDLLRINKKKITASPITFYVTLDKNRNPIAHLRLVAESLGSIPPCTALMIVTTKTKRYEVHLSSSFQKNATLELFLKE